MKDPIATLAKQHQVSVGAVEAIVSALRATGGKSAQFNHPELGGMGQWMPGMLMLGDMFNNSLKAKVEKLIGDVLIAMPDLPLVAAGKAGLPDMFGAGLWWPKSLGTPTASGTQNAMRYAYFADANRLAVKIGETVFIYDTGDYRITGVSQQQASSSGVDEHTILFSSPRGNFDLTHLKRVQRLDASEIG